ncbi:YveK family protein [Paenibacillus glycinis]|uniref:Lipopolysaccharide biosynthesis protein n=1 Tax=Paenibacillus glycinis TaxID=2697035 RepID=A0ABW9XM42_9BACL|nr:Wzz/FepE/Etk N-terminal domain-containing protein [Paenibacillus glycinis]NBD23613.1 lipopolysaccharide biosynthesis protein [Paenibacillus glycinis]
MEIKEFVKVVTKRLGIVLTLFILITGATVYYAYYQLKPEYQATSNMVVNKMMRTEDTNTLSYDGLLANRGLIDTYKKIVLNPTILNKVVELNPDLRLTTPHLLEQLSVNSDENTQIISISAENESYERSAKIVNAVTNVFVAEIPKIMRIDNVVILNLAPEQFTSDIAPVSLNPALYVIVAFIASLILGIGLAHLLEYLDVTIKTEEDVTDVIGYPTVAIIPKASAMEIKSRKAKLKNKVKDQPMSLNS